MLVVHTATLPCSLIRLAGSLYPSPVIASRTSSVLELSQTYAENKIIILSDHDKTTSFSALEICSGYSGLRRAC